MLNRLARLWISLACAAAGFSAQAESGRVVDAKTGTPIERALVTVGAEVVRSGEGGHFSLEADGDLRVRAPGYKPAKVAPSKAGITVRLVPFEPKALYLSSYGVGTPRLRDAAFAAVHRGTANAIVVDIKGDRGLVNYPSEVALAGMIGARALTTIASLPAFVKTLHDAGIYAIARLVVFKDDPLASARPDLAVKLADGNLYKDREGLAWSDPFQNEVWRYNIDIAREAAQAGFDEVQFDYLRFPDATVDLRYSRPVSKAARIEAIGGFLADARRALTPYNTFLAVDFFGYVCWNLTDTGIGQDLPTLAQWADYLSPMLYPSGFGAGIPGFEDPISHPYEIVKRSLDQARDRIGVAPQRFRPWLQAFRDYAFDKRDFRSEEINAQIRAAKDFGANGWMLWNARNDYDGLRVADTSRGVATSNAQVAACN